VIAALHSNDGGAAACFAATTAGASVTAAAEAAVVLQLTATALAEEHVPALLLPNIQQQPQ